MEDNDGCNENKGSVIYRRYWMIDIVSYKLWLLVVIRNVNEWNLECCMDNYIV